MTDEIEDYEPKDIVENVDVNVKGADAIAWVHVPGEEDSFLYAWDTEESQPVMSICSFDPEGMQKFSEWTTNAKVERELER